MRRIAIVVFLGLSCALAQESTSANPNAKAAYEKGEIARKTGNTKGAIADYRRAIDLDPNFTDAHERYIFETEDFATRDVRDAVFSPHPTPEQEARFKKEREAADAQLEAQYEKWAKVHPDKPGYQWALGDMNIYRNPKAAIEHFEATIKMDPKFAPGYQSLSLMDEVQGDLEGMRENLHKAVEAAPGDPKYLFDYAYAFHDSDPEQFKTLCEELLNRFPESAQAAQAYYWLAAQAPTDEEKVHYLEQLKGDKAPAAADWKGGGMMMLFDIYEKSDRTKASALAQEMLHKGDKDDKSLWKTLADYSQAMLDADQLVKDGKADLALAKLDAVKLPKWVDKSQLVLERARVLDASRQTQKAYDTMLESYAATPTDETHAALLHYGQLLGKEATKVSDEVWALQAKNAHPATDFSLPTYPKGKDLSLADFHGHVILLNFWYPLCGPCRGEFPYIQSVLDKYKDQGFEIVAVNVAPKQDDFVLPLLKGFHLGFIPLRGSDEFASEKYHVRGEPTNFLIGADGQLYFGPLEPVSSPTAQRTLELQVLALLQHSRSNSGSPSQ